MSPVPTKVHLLFLVDSVSRLQEFGHQTREYFKKTKVNSDPESNQAVF